LTALDIKEVENASGLATEVPNKVTL